jgi:hypothetical protein
MNVNPGPGQYPQKGSVDTKSGRTIGKEDRGNALLIK